MKHGKYISIYLLSALLILIGIVLAVSGYVGAYRAMSKEMIHLEDHTSLELELEEKGIYTIYKVDVFTTSSKMDDWLLDSLYDDLEVRLAESGDKLIEDMASRRSRYHFDGEAYTPAYSFKIDQATRVLIKTGRLEGDPVGKSLLLSRDVDLRTEEIMTDQMIVLMIFVSMGMGLGISCLLGHLRKISLHKQGLHKKEEL